MEHGPECYHNAHMFFIKTSDKRLRGEFATFMKASGIVCSPHYVPLHHRPIFQKLGRFSGEDKYTTSESDCLIRLPLYYGLSEKDQDLVVQHLLQFFEDKAEVEEHVSGNRDNVVTENGMQVTNGVSRVSTVAS